MRDSLRFSLWMVAVACSLGLAGMANAGTLTWTGAADTGVFNEANWDLDGGGAPAAGTIEPATAVNHDLVIGAGTPVINGASFASPLDVGQGGAGSLTMTGGFLDAVAPLGNNGVRADGASPDVPNSPFAMSGTASAELTFMLDLDVTLGDSAMLTLIGAGNPVNRTVVDLTSLDATVVFTAETVEQFTNEHLSKFTVNGAPAEIGTNLSVVSDGGAGSIVTAIPEPSAIVLMGLGLIGLIGIRRRK